MRQHLIIIRGNSATGKTTLAASLQRAIGRGTANIGQDHFRRVVLREHDVPDGANIELIGATARHCVRIGYHVIIEGILVESHYGPMLRTLVDEHRGPAHVYYLDLPLSESITRHEQRPLFSTVPSAKLRDWYVPDDLLRVSGEQVLDARQSVDKLMTTILDEVGPIDHFPDATGARFL